MGTTQPYRIVWHAATPVAAHREQIRSAIKHGLSNGLVESMNTKIRLLTRIVFGFARPEAPVSLACSPQEHQPSLSGRSRIGSGLAPFRDTQATRP
ncbi:transposase [Rhodococcus fascians]|nr:transposase [Rhodococcus fascians]MBY3810454.1 transposase [Rhodococcus fascians]MBY3841923.1 transposase [Rhodococcus fascians]MBY3844374.1 transposase [Rhodococcus fascians]MBY3850320.1 transposase [Rhodococcus fascians]